MKGKKLLMVGLVLAALVIGQTASAEHRLGLGAHYNLSARSLDEGLDIDGLSYLITYQYVYGFLKLEGDLEMFPSGTGAGVGDETAFVPQVHALLGGILYGGLGVGLVYAGGEFADDPMYNLRLGVDIPIDCIHIDINANYAFTDFGSLGNIDTDLIKLGVAARYEF